MADSLRRLVNIGSFTILQGKLEKWAADYRYNSVDENVAQGCELIELNARVQGQLFRLLSLCAAEGGIYGGASRIKSRLLPLLGDGFFSSGLSSETSLSILADAALKTREVDELRKIYESSLAELDSDLKLKNDENEDLKMELEETRQELDEQNRASVTDKMFHEKEIRDLKDKLSEMELEDDNLKMKLDDSERQVRLLREEVALLTGRGPCPICPPLHHPHSLLDVHSTRCALCSPHKYHHHLPTPVNQGRCILCDPLPFASKVGESLTKPSRISPEARLTAERLELDEKIAAKLKEKKKKWSDADEEAGREEQAEKGEDRWSYQEAKVSSDESKREERRSQKKDVTELVGMKQDRQSYRSVLEDRAVPAEMKRQERRSFYGETTAVENRENEPGQRTSSMGLAPTEDLAVKAQQQRLIARFNDLFSVDRLDALDILRRVVDDYEANQRVLFEAVVESFKCAQLAFKEANVRQKADPEEPTDLGALVRQVGRSFDLPAGCSKDAISFFVREACRLAWQMAALPHPFSLGVASGGDLLDEHKYRRSYDSEFTAPLVHHHIWPCLLQGSRVVVKGEACTRRGATSTSRGSRNHSRSSSRSQSPMRHTTSNPGSTTRTASTSLSHYGLNNLPSA